MTNRSYCTTRIGYDDFSFFVPGMAVCSDKKSCQATCIGNNDIYPDHNCAVKSTQKERAELFFLFATDPGLISGIAADGMIKRVSGKITLFSKGRNGSEKFSFTVSHRKRIIPRLPAGE